MEGKGATHERFGSWKRQPPDNKVKVNLDHNNTRPPSWFATISDLLCAHDVPVQLKIWRWCINNYIESGTCVYMLCLFPYNLIWWWYINNSPEFGTSEVWQVACKGAVRVRVWVWGLGGVWISFKSVIWKEKSRISLFILYKIFCKKFVSDFGVHFTWRSTNLIQVLI